MNGRGRPTGPATIERGTHPPAAGRPAERWGRRRSAAVRALAALGLVTFSFMLVLVTLVSLLVQIYSLAYLHDEPPASLGRYYTYQSLFAFSMLRLTESPKDVSLPAELADALRTLETREDGS